MKAFSINILSLGLVFSLAACGQTPKQVASADTTELTTKTIAMSHNDKGKKVMKSDEEWKAQLTPEQYRILRMKGTERAFTGEYWDDKSECTYQCAGCGLDLFDSDSKFKSGTGWPSFHSPVDEEHIIEHRDVSYGMVRVEVVCGGCDGHLGHVFPDGPQPTGLRYCINSASLAKVEK